MLTPGPGGDLRVSTELALVFLNHSFGVATVGRERSESVALIEYHPQTIIGGLTC
jgi:hypothetical protein